MRTALKAQSLLEYAIILGVVAAAIGAMQLYFRRGIQAAIKASADELGVQADSAAKRSDVGMSSFSDDRVWVDALDQRAAGTTTVNHTVTTNSTSATTVSAESYD